MTSLEVNRLTATNPGTISKEFNNHSSTTASKLESEIDADSGDYQRYLTCTDTRFHLHPTNANKVFSLKNKLNRFNTTSLEKIFARLIRECANLFCGPICDICGTPRTNLMFDYHAKIISKIVLVLLFRTNPQRETVAWSNNLEAYVELN